MALIRGAKKAKRKEDNTAVNNYAENDAFQQGGKKLVMEHPYFIIGCVAAIIVIVVIATLITSAVRSGSDASALEYAQAVEMLDNIDPAAADSAEKYKEALAAFDKVIKNQSGSINAAASLVYSGKINKEMGNTDKAVDFFKQAKSSSKLDTDLRFVAYEGEALAYFDKGEYENAAKIWEGWLSQKTTIYMDYALYYIGQCNEKLGKNDEAAKYYKRIKDEYPNSVLIAKIIDKLPKEEPKKAEN